MTEVNQHLLVFGATGTIGSAVCEMAADAGWRVTGVVRNPVTPPSPAIQYLVADPLSTSFEPQSLAAGTPYTAVCWAQGMNTTDSVRSLDRTKHLELYNANCVFILATMQALLTDNLLAPASRLCIISSIWQNLARQNKLSYCMTKAALQGLVLSASVDLAAEGHLINAVLPGAVDTPMTRANLAAEQIERIAGGTQFNRLTSLQDVASAVCYLCSPQNTGITGQFISVDLGWSRARIV